MTGTLFWPDVSHWQVPVDDRFAGPFLMYKVSEGATYLDPNAARNGAWCHANSGPGRKLVGHGGYHVWAPGNEQAQADLFFANARVSQYFVAMIDVESWRNPGTGKPRYSGDHSASITALVNLFVAKLGRQRVKVYGNSGDLSDLYPRRPAWLGPVRAGYSSSAPPEPWVGWQYTDGSDNFPAPTGWPKASAPFGRCDHNAYYGTPAQFAAAWGLPDPSTPVAKPPAPSTLPAGAISLPPPQKEDAMDTRILIVDKATVPKGKAWPGDYLQGANLRIRHIVDEQSFHAYAAAGVKVAPPITYAEWDSYRAGNLIDGPVKA